MTVDVPFEEHRLANGLRVVVHEDRSTPVAAVFVFYHVGSTREEAGRSGFAHLFEHMLFQGSENVPEGEHFRLVQAAGGTLNGTTNEDRTNYFETVPRNWLELGLWLESDRMGFLLPAMTQEKLDNQRDVVKNERRQSYDNRPYGRVSEEVRRAMFPPEHPLHRLPIGSMEDLDRATLADVESFFRRWYAPSNAVLAVGGDVGAGEVLRLAERWFGPLPAGPPVEAPRPVSAALEDERRVLLPDRVRVPQVTLAWPTVEEWHPDEAPLTLLADVLSANRSAVLDEALMVREELASRVAISHHAMEVGGLLSIDLRPREGVTLDRLVERVDALLEEVLRRGVEPERLERLANRREGMVLRALDNVSARTNLLGHYATLRGDPGLLAADLARHRAVTPDDVARVARRYVAGRPRVRLDVVPEARVEAA